MRRRGYNKETATVEFQLLDRDNIGGAFSRAGRPRTVSVGGAAARVFFDGY